MSQNLASQEDSSSRYYYGRQTAAELARDLAAAESCAGAAQPWGYTQPSQELDNSTNTEIQSQTQEGTISTPQHAASYDDGLVRASPSQVSAHESVEVALQQDSQWSTNANAGSLGSQDSQSLGLVSQSHGATEAYYSQELLAPTGLAGHTPYPSQGDEAPE